MSGGGSAVKLFISPDELRKSSFKLGKSVVESGFNPNFMVALWRGGTPIGCHVHEYLKRFGNSTSVDHFPIRTSRYDGVDSVKEKVSIHGLECGEIFFFISHRLCLTS